MRVAVSGTHASGKSTLIADVLEAVPGLASEPEPYEWLDEGLDEPDADSFFRQLEASARQHAAHAPNADVIVERAPIDFVAYLQALDALGREGSAPALTEQAGPLAADGMRHVDLLVVLPLDAADGIAVPASEDLPLRQAANDALLELCDDGGLLSSHTDVIELAGSRARRVEALIARLAAGPA